MLPFELPSCYEYLQWRRKNMASQHNTVDTPKISSPGVLSDDDLLSIPNSRPASRASSTHSTSAHTTQFTITPDVPQDILISIDDAVNEGEVIRATKP